MGFETDLLAGLAQLLHDAGIATWRAGGGYAVGETGITVDAVPDTPARLVALADFPVTDDPTLSDSTIGVQIRTRWEGMDPRPVKDLDSAIFDRLHGMPATTLATGVHVDGCLRRSGAPMGQDAAGRWERTSTYYLTLHRPSTNRT